MSGGICAVLLTLGTLAFAAGEKVGPCVDEIPRLCPNAKTRRQIHKCLFANKNKIRVAACRNGGIFMFPGEATVPECLEEGRKFCVGEHTPNVKTAKGLMRCLKSNEGSLSDICRRVILDPCELDVVTYCDDANYGDELDQCLRENLKKLSVECRNVVLRVPSFTRPGESGPGRPRR